MSKKDFIAMMAERHGMTKVAASEMYDVVFGDLVDALSEGNEVAIPALGKFKIAERPARTAHNPRTMESVEVPAKKVVKFAPAKGIKDAVAEL